jgi:hypothetical protein
VLEAAGHDRKRNHPGERFPLPVAAKGRVLSQLLFTYIFDAPQVEHEFRQLLVGSLDILLRTQSLENQICSRLR